MGKRLGRPPEPDARHENVQVRFTPEERDRIDAAARAQGTSRAGFVRGAALGALAVAIQRNAEHRMECVDEACPCTVEDESLRAEREKLNDKPKGTV